MAAARRPFRTGGRGDGELRRTAGVAIVCPASGLRIRNLDGDREFWVAADPRSDDLAASDAIAEMACTVLRALVVTGIERTDGTPTIPDKSAGSDRALEFRVGCVHLLVRVDRVARLIEVPCAPLPLVRPLVLGLGFDDDRPVICVALSRRTAASDGAMVKAVLLTTATRVGWALCIDEVFNLISVVEISPIDRAAAKSPLPPWVRRARTADGRAVGWIDADDMIRDLAARREIAR
jgi:chemotaxis signal transduction protein